VGDGHDGDSVSSSPTTVASRIIIIINDSNNKGKTSPRWKRRVMDTVNNVKEEKVVVVEPMVGLDAIRLTPAGRVMLMM
jgi:hypothetical protein